MSTAPNQRGVGGGLSSRPRRQAAAFAASATLGQAVMLAVPTALKIGLIGCGSRGTSAASQRLADKERQASYDGGCLR